MAHHQYEYRYRIGDYRVFFNIVGNTMNIVSIERLKKEMNALTNVQYINNAQGVPAFAVIPLQTFNWLKQKANLADPLETGIPEEVAKRALLNDYSALRAWREHLGLTQAEVAKRLGISQSAYSQQENSQRLRKTTRLKMATALGIHRIS